MGVSVSSLTGYGSLKTFRWEIEFWSFCSQTGHGFCTLVLNLVCSVLYVFKRSYVFIIIDIRPAIRQ